MTIPVLYPKIETLWNRDPKTFIVNEGDWRCPEFALIKPDAWRFQEKVDGTNIRIGWDGQQVEIAGRSDNANIPGDLVTKLAKIFTPQSMNEAFPALEEYVVLFGEGYGAGIQKGGGDYRPDKSFILFDVRVGEWWLEIPDVMDVARKLHIDSVKTYGGSLDEMVTMLKEQKLPSLCAANQRLAEGVIARTEPTLRFRDGSRIMWKLKHCDFKGGRR